MNRSRYVTFCKLYILLLCTCCLLVACSNESKEGKGEIDLQGKIIEVDYAENRILVEDLQKGSTWVTLHENGDIERYEDGLEVAVWVAGGIDTSSPSSTSALNIEIINSKE